MNQVRKKLDVVNDYIYLRELHGSSFLIKQCVCEKCVVISQYIQWGLFGWDLVE